MGRVTLRMGQVTSRMRQVMDGGAAIRAGIISGAFFLVAVMALTWWAIGSPWVITRLVASLILGPEALPPPATFTVGTAVVALIVHFALSIGYAMLIAFVLHRWGMVVGIVGGAILGLAIFAINFYTVSYLVPWFFPMRSWMLVASHALFGAMAGGIYEAMEVERFVPESDKSQSSAT